MTCGIYCIENVNNGKKYIGQSINVEKRMYASHRKCDAIWRAIEKYGKENFKTYVILYCEKSELSYYEIECIKIFHSHFTENGYNISFGGNTVMNGRNHSKNSKEKISESLKEQWKLGYRKSKPWTLQQKEKIKGKIPWNKGKSGIYIDRKNKNSLSKYLGVSFHTGKRNKNWVARFKNIYIGYYETQIEAAKARDKYILENNIKQKLNFLNQ